jgi:hypothetical protein
MLCSANECVFDPLIRQLYPNRAILIGLRVAVFSLPFLVLVYVVVMAFLAELSPVMDVSVVLLSSLQVLYSLLLIGYGIVILRFVQRGAVKHRSAVRNSLVLLVVACVLFASFLLVLVGSCLAIGALWDQDGATWFPAMMAASEFVIASAFLTAVFLTYRPALVRRAPIETESSKETPLIPTQYDI